MGRGVDDAVEANLNVGNGVAIAYTSRPIAPRACVGVGVGVSVRLATADADDDVGELYVGNSQ